MQNSFWSLENITILKSLINSGKKAKEISQIMAIDINSIRRVARKHNLSLKKERSYLTDFQKKEIHDLINKGMSYLQISKSLRIRIYLVTYYCHKYNLKELVDENYKNWSNFDTEKLIDIKINNPTLPLRKVASIMKKSTNSVSRKLKELDLSSGLARKLEENRQLQNFNLKKCWKCLSVKSITDDFYDKKNNWCLSCVKEQRKIAHSQNVLSFPMIVKARISHSKVRAKKMKKDFDLSLEFILRLFKNQSGKCFYSGRDMNLGLSHPDTLSIDRVDSTRGYTEDNVVLCCYKINNMKNDLPLEDFIKTINDIANYQKNNKLAGAG